jgi:hypothetical protein
VEEQSRESDQVVIEKGSQHKTKVAVNTPPSAEQINSAEISSEEEPEHTSKHKGIALSSLFDFNLSRPSKNRTRWEETICITEQG